MIIKIIAILYFVVNELPKFLETLEKIRKDNAYKTSKDQRAAALSEYKKSPTAKTLKKLEGSQ